MEKEKRKREIKDFLPKWIPSGFPKFVFHDMVDRIISQEEEMIKAAEDKAVFEFANEFYQYCHDYQIKDLLNKLLEARGIKEKI